MQEHNKGSVRFFSYRAFDPYTKVTNVVSTRVGGRSKPPYDSLNLGLHVGDDPDTVLENRAALCQALGIEPERPTIPEQVHGNAVAVVDASQRGAGAIVDDDALRGADAVVTNAPEVPLVVFVADCVAVSFFDPEQSAVGLAHAGWKGTVGRIAERTLAAMGEAFGSKPADVIVGVSPAIGPGHYEVGQDVVDAYRKEFGKEGSAVFIQEDMHGTFYLDLWGANIWQLQSAGVAADHITSTEMCTACHPDLFYSHRHENGRTGRFAGLIMLHGSTMRAYYSIQKN